LTPIECPANIVDMRRVQILSFFAALMLAVAPTLRGQDAKDAPKKTPAVEVDPDADKYSTEKKYVPPGAVKSVEIGNFYLRRKKYSGALSRFQEAVQENPTYAPAYLGLGRVYDHMGLKQKALENYQKYLDALPSEKDALEAKNVQHDVARLERELKAQGSKPHTGSGHAAGNPQSQ
jgi:tetratricopeptide (TPR) repeat protein